MKTLEVVVKNVELARETAALANVKVVREKLISKCTLMVLEGDFDGLMDFNDNFFLDKRDLHRNYQNEILAQ